MESEEQPNLVSTVLFLFGIAQRERLPGTLLIRWLGDVGVPATTARSALARMRAQGALRSHRQGRTSEYELTGLLGDSFRRTRDTASSEPAGAWSGELHVIVFSIPEAHRGARDRLRRAARLAGYGLLQPGVMVAVQDRWPQVSAELGPLPQHAHALPGRLPLPLERARCLAADVWHLDHLGEQVNRVAERLERAAATPSPAAGPDALRRYVGLTLPVYRLLSSIPQLPPELLGDDWPLPRLLRALARTRADHWDSAGRYVHGLLETDRHH